MFACSVHCIMNHQKESERAMKYDVWITVRGEQHYEGAAPDKTELTTPGMLEKTENGWVLTYQETELTGLEGTCTTLQIEPKRTTLRRSGVLNAEMVFEEGKVHTSLYEMPFGMLTLEVCANSIRRKLSERGGLLELCYRITIGGQTQSINSLKIRIRRRM